MHRRPTPKQYPSDFIGGKPVLSTGYLVSCSRTQRSASGEARTRNPSISGQALYHDCAPQLGSILCRYDTCPTQYAPDLRGSILCMQGTQYAPRESILCMEHFVALHTTSYISVDFSFFQCRAYNLNVILFCVFICKLENYLALYRLVVALLNFLLHSILLGYPVLVTCADPVETYALLTELPVLIREYRVLRILSDSSHTAIGGNQKR